MVTFENIATIREKYRLKKLLERIRELLTKHEKGEVVSEVSFAVAEAKINEWLQRMPDWFMKRREFEALRALLRRIRVEGAAIGKAYKNIEYLEYYFELSPLKFKQSGKESKSGRIRRGNHEKAEI